LLFTVRAVIAMDTDGVAEVDVCWGS
jgi:hypothetical protein